jgi:hypothetical protein
MAAVGDLLATDEVRCPSLSAVHNMGVKTMPKKSDRKLVKRMEQLKARGFDAFGVKNATIAEIIEVIGDLTVAEFERMLLIERSRAEIAVTTRLDPVSAASREADRQRTLKRQAELRAQKEKGAGGGS